MKRISIQLIQPSEKIRNVRSSKCTPVIKSGCAALTWHFTTLCFASSSLNIWLTFQAKNNVRNNPVSIAFAQISHQSYNTRTTNRHLCGNGERNREQR